MVLPSGDRMADSAAIGNLFVTAPVCSEMICTDFWSPCSRRTQMALSPSMLTFLRRRIVRQRECRASTGGRGAAAGCGVPCRRHNCTVLCAARAACCQRACSAARARPRMACRRWQHRRAPPTPTIVASTRRRGAHLRPPVTRSVTLATVVPRRTHLKPIASWGIPSAGSDMTTRRSTGMPAMVGGLRGLQGRRVWVRSRVRDAAAAGVSRQASARRVGTERRAKARGCGAMRAPAAAADRARTCTPLQFLRGRPSRSPHSLARTRSRLTGLRSALPKWRGRRHSLDAVFGVLPASTRREHPPRQQ